MFNLVSDACSQSCCVKHGNWKLDWERVKESPEMNRNSKGVHYMSTSASSSEEDVGSSRKNKRCISSSDEDVPEPVAGSSSQGSVKKVTVEKPKRRQEREGRPIRSKAEGGVSEARVKKRSRRRYMPGDAALAEIRRLQRTTKLLIPRIAFQRVVREITADLCLDQAYRYLNKKIVTYL